MKIPVRVLMAMGVLFAGIGEGGTRRHDVDDNVHITLGEDFPEVCRITSGDGSGVLINERWVLTAAHVAGYWDYVFLGFGGDESYRGKVFKQPQYNHSDDINIKSEYDIALIRLDQSIDHVIPAQLSSGSSYSVINQPARIVGWGRSGTGVFGRDGEETRLVYRRAGDNMIDMVGQDFRSDSPTNLCWVDFDIVGVNLNNAMGSTEPLQYEYFPVDGDSGGPWYVNTADGREVVALSTFVAEYRLTALWPEVFNFHVDGAYSDVAAGVMVSSHSDWINQIIMSNTVVDLSHDGPWTSNIGDSFLITGSVSQLGEPVEGASLEVVLPSTGTVLGNATTDSLGQYSIILAGFSVSGSFDINIVATYSGVSSQQSAFLTVNNPIEGYDLALESVDVPTSRDPNSTFAVRAGVRNKGDYSAGGTLRAKLFNSSGTLVDEDSVSVSTLTPGSVSTTYSLSLNTGPSEGQGTVIVSVETIPGDENTSDNIASYGIYIGNRPDVDGYQAVNKYYYASDFPKEVTVGAYSFRLLGLNSSSGALTVDWIKKNGSTIKSRFSMDEGEFVAYDDDQAVIFYSNYFNIGGAQIELFLGAPPSALSASPGSQSVVRGVRAEFRLSANEDINNAEAVVDWRDGGIIAGVESDSGDGDDRLYRVNTSTLSPGNYEWFVLVDGDYNYYFQRLELTVVDAHDLAVTSVITSNSTVSIGDSALVTAQCTTSGGYTEQAVVSLSIIGPDGYSALLTHDVVSILETGSVQFDWQTIGCVPGEYTLTATGSIGSDSNSGNNSASATVTVTGPPEYTITVSEPVNGTLSPPGNQIVVAGQSTEFAVEPGVGYEVAYWLLDGMHVNAGSTNLSLLNVQDDHSVSVQLLLKEYIVTATSSDGGAISPVGNNSVEHGHSIEFTATADDGYILDGWYVDGEPQSLTNFILTLSSITNHHIVRAQFMSTGIMLIFDSAGGTAVDPVTQDFGTAVTPPADPTRIGYTFAGWVPEIPPTMPATNLTLTAQWTINQYTLTFDSAGGTSIDPITQDFGTAVTAPAAPMRTGYMFTGWLPAVPSSMPATNMTLSAQYERIQLSVEVSGGEGGLVSPSGSNALYYGDSLSVSITPYAHYYVQDVLVDGASVGSLNSYEFSSITTNHSLEAFFNFGSFDSGFGTALDAGSLILQSYANRYYTIWTTDDLTSGTWVTYIPYTNILGNDSVLHIPMATNGSPAAFYRASVSLHPEELSSDSDFDSLPDDWEITYFGDLSQDADSDYDGDGRTNSEELSDGTDPVDAGSRLGLVAYYSFEGNAQDQSANGHDGTIYGDVGFVEGLDGLAADFDGFGDYITIAAGELVAQDDFSLSVWIKPRNVDVVNESGVQWPQYHVLYSQSDNNLGRTTHNCLLLDEGLVAYNNWLPGGATASSSSGTGIDEWHYVSIVRSNATVYFYIDGQLDAVDVGSPRESAGDIDFTLIGARYYFGRTYHVFDGLMDELAVYDRPLSSNEVFRLYQASAPPAVLFSEDWESGIDPVKWKTFGNPVPQVIDGAGIDGSQAMDPNGDYNYHSGVVSHDTLDLQEISAYEFSVYMHQSTVNWEHIAVGLSETNSLGYTADGPQSIGFLRIWAQSEAALNRIQYTVYDETFEESWDSSFDNVWMQFKAEINEDHTVSFYRDGSHIHTSTSQLELDHFSAQSIFILGRSAGENQYVDNILVYGADNQ